MGKYICYTSCDITPSGWHYRIEKDQTCHENCKDTATHKFREAESKVCIEKCPKDKLFYTDTNECYKRCPAGYYRVPGSYSCEPTKTWQLLFRKMQFLETTYNYVYSHMRSFASIDLYIQSPLRVAGFLYASERVAYLRLRATTRVKEEVDYAPVIFFNAQKMVHSELQYTALRPYESFVLAVNMLTKTTLF